MRTYTFKVVVEPDEGGYHAYCAALRRLGAVTQGATHEEALKNINEVVRMIVDEMASSFSLLTTSRFEGMRIAVKAGAEAIAATSTWIVAGLFGA